MLETVDGSGSGGVFVDENQASCGSILPTGNLHLSPIGAVLQQARKLKPAAGERPAIAGARSPKIWDGPASARTLQFRRCTDKMPDGVNNYHDGKVLEIHEAQGQ